MEPSEPSLAGIYRQQTLDKWMHQGEEDNNSLASLLEDGEAEMLHNQSD